MKISDTISVDPGKITLGDRNSKVMDSLIRTNILNDENARHYPLSAFLFPSVSRSHFMLDYFSVPLRTIFSALLIIVGIVSLQQISAPFALGFAIIEISLGVMLALGLFSRIFMALGAVFFGISGAIALRSGVADLNLFFLMFGCILFFLIGAGKYSCDAMIGKLLKRNNGKKNNSVNALDYKAFHHAAKKL